MLGSLATVHLGLGLVATNASHSARHGGETMGYFHNTPQPQVRRDGGLFGVLSAAVIVPRRVWPRARSPATDQERPT